MVNEFPFGTSQSGKRDYLFRISVCPGNFPVGRTKKTFTIYIPTEISDVVNGKQPYSHWLTHLTTEPVLTSLQGLKVHDRESYC